MSRYTTCRDGRFYKQPLKDRTMCCDCGLVHDIEYRIEGQSLEVKYTRNVRATAAARRSKPNATSPENREGINVRSQA